MPGRYPISFYSFWSGSTFDDTEAYLEYIDAPSED